MPRWEPNSVGRLQEAAMVLLEMHGLDGVTVADIARAAGLSERTFFNHFASKADVLFGPRTQQHRQLVVDHIAAADLTVPLDAVVDGLRAAADELFDGLHAASVRRRRIIDSNAALREREDAKRTDLTGAITDALTQHGLDPDSAVVTARAGLLVQQTAEDRWCRTIETTPFREALDDALRTLRTITSMGPEAT